MRIARSSNLKRPTNHDVRGNAREYMGSNWVCARRPVDAGAVANCLSRLALSPIPLKELVHAPPEQREQTWRRDDRDAYIGAYGNTMAQFVGQEKATGKLYAARCPGKRAV